MGTSDDTSFEFPYVVTYAGNLTGPRPVTCKCDTGSFTNQVDLYLITFCTKPVEPAGRRT